MIQGVFSVIWAGLIIAMMVLGAVLLFKLFASNLGQWTRVILAAGFGSSLLLVPVMFFGFLGAGFETGAILAMLLAAIVPFAVVGLPVSMIATRKMDKIVNFGVRETFE